MTEDNSYSTYFLGDYLIAYDPNILVKKYECKDFHSISFLIGDWEYCLVHNYVIGDRILISSKMGDSRDIPFKVETFRFLPEKVNARKIK